MRSVTVGRISGIPIRLNASLLVFLPVLAYLLGSETQIGAYASVVGAISPHPVDEAALLAGSTPIVIGVIGALGLFVGVLLHELGHSYTAQHFGISIESITLWIFGGMARMTSMPDEWDVEFWVALAGPVTSAGLALVAYLTLFALPAGSTLLIFLVGWFAVINVSLAVFNMLPAFPMDGGRILRALLARWLSLSRATQIAADIARALAVGMVLFGLLVVFAPMLVLIAVFVYVAAGAEARTTLLREALHGVSAGDLAREGSVQTVDADTSVADLLDRMRRDRADAYPVVEGGSLVGLVSLASLRTVADEDIDRTTVEAVMRSDPPTCSPAMPAIEALELLAAGGVDRLVLVEGDTVVGTVSSGDLVEFLQYRGLTGRGDPAVPTDHVAD